MRTSHPTARWGLLALFALVAFAGCHDTDTLLVDEAEWTEGVALETREVHIPEHWAKWWDKRDHCADEEEQLRETGWAPPPWVSYCRNPRPLETGTFSRASRAKLNQELKRDWDERHGLTPLGSDSK